MFKAAIKAVTQRADDAPRPGMRRRRGKQEGGGPLYVMRRLLQQGGKRTARGRYAALEPVLRASSLPAELPHAGSEWDVFDIAGLAYEHAFDDSVGMEFDTKSDYLSPGL